MPYQISDEDARILREMRQWQRNFNGSGVSSSSAGATIGTGRRRQAVVRRQFVPPNVHFQVDLVQDDGGSSTQGSKTTAAGFTYKIRNVGKTKDLATGKSPQWGRWNGKRTAATKGAAYYDNNGDLQLAFAYETLGTTSCS